MSMDKWFFDQARRGNVFHTSNSVARITTVSNSGTGTGLAVFNPANSTKWLVMKNFQFAATTDGTDTGSLCLVVHDALSVVILGTQTTATVIHNAIARGSDIGVGVAIGSESWVAAGTPVLIRGVMGQATTVGDQDGFTEFNGDLIIPPGGMISTEAVGDVYTGVGSFTWAEVTPY